MTKNRQLYYTDRLLKAEVVLSGLQTITQLDHHFLQLLDPLQAHGNALP